MTLNITYTLIEKYGPYNSIIIFSGALIVILIGKDIFLYYKDKKKDDDMQ